MSGDFSFLKGNIYTIILCALYGKDGQSGEKYGYEIAREIKERTDGKYEIKQPTLYSYLKKLEQQDLIESFWGTESNGGRRRYYKLTPKGRHDCEQFIAEWEYHKNVLSVLVDTPETPIEVNQDQVTPLFGEKQKRSKPSASHIQQMNEQEELARRLDELFGGTDTAESAETSTSEVPEIVFVEDGDFEQQSMFDVMEPAAEEVDETAATVTEEPVAVAPVVAETEPIVDTTDATVDISRFEVNQDNAEEFLQQFDERARIIAETMDTTTDSGENYQHVLMRVLGDQLDEMQEYNDDQQDVSARYHTEHPVALEVVADNLAQQGIRLRIYSHASSNYKPKTLIPLSKVICKTAWLTYLVAIIYFGILIFTSINLNNWQPFLITIATLALAPIVFTIYSLLDPSRREKPTFSYKKFLFGSIVLAIIIVLFALSISIISHIELSNYIEVSTQILIPTGVAILLPVAVVVFNSFYKKY